MKKSGILLYGLVTGQNGDVAILAFDHRMRVMQDFTSDPEKLDDAMQKITAGSSTSALVDAVLQSDRMLKQHDRQNVRRRVVILMSRNVDKGSEAKLQETVRAMQFDNVIVYAIDISKVKTAALKKMDLPRPANGGIHPKRNRTLPAAFRGRKRPIAADGWQLAERSASGVSRCSRSVQKDTGRGVYNVHRRKRLLLLQPARTGAGDHGYRKRSEQPISPEL